MFELLLYKYIIFEYYLFSKYLSNRINHTTKINVFTEFSKCFDNKHILVISSSLQSMNFDFYIGILSLDFVGSPYLEASKGWQGLENCIQIHRLRTPSVTIRRSRCINIISTKGWVKLRALNYLSVSESTSLVCILEFFRNCLTSATTCNWWDSLNVFSVLF